MSTSTAAPRDVDFSLFGGAESLLEGKGRAPRRTVVTAPTTKDDGKGYPAPPQDPSDFLWLMTEEPHRSRRTAIMKAHPEVTKLMGHEPLTKFVVLFVVLLQVGVAISLRHTKPLSPLFLLCAYAIGGTANHNLFLAIHEITHNLAFRGVAPNKLLAIFANLPIGIPYSTAFKPYHIEHHKFLGQDGIDTDLPTRLELLCLNNVLGKVFFATFQILFYALRPTFVRAQVLTRWHFFNIFVQVVFDFCLVSMFGVRPLIYLIASSFFAGSLHPCAGHFIAEHYLWDGLDQETYSYYGPLNVLAYNVGYHNEHHDFPSIPWTRLPALRALAPEFYDTIPSHPSWPMVIVNFIRDKEVGMFARAKRVLKNLPTSQAIMSAQQTKRIVVIGAGVIGLTTALKLQELGGYEVIIIAETFPTDPKTVKYTSHWAGAHHVSYEPSGTEKHKIDKDTFDVMWKMSEPGSPTDHLFMRLEQEEHYYVEQPQPSHLAHMPNFHYLPNEAFVPSAVGAVAFNTITIDTPRYVNYLFSKFLSAGGQIERASLQHINQVIEGGAKVFSTPKDAPKVKADAIIVCAGLGARTLGGVEDKAVHPIRGQTVLIRAPWIKFGRTLSSENVWTYIIPRRSGDVIVGGTRVADDWYPKARPETTIDILTRALAICPELAPSEVRAQRAPTIDDIKPIIIEEGCGFRPGRTGGLRLEVEWFEETTDGVKLPIVYNYGHAGSGFQSSWGSAAVAVELLQEALAIGP
ncbi:hypothetical protein ONZ45_g8437 [Pleurotus djamor]|nr:hypothetical protein ONZ45_g8437 [Pleurotus djamor]